MTRRPLPERRHSETFQVRIWNLVWTVTLGYYDEGLIDVGETFINCGKSGEQSEGIARDSAILLSIALQYGADIEALKHAITRNADGTPATIVGAIIDKLESPPGPGEQGPDAKELP